MISNFLAVVFLLAGGVIGLLLHHYWYGEAS